MSYACLWALETFLFRFVCLLFSFKRIHKFFVSIRISYFHLSYIQTSLICLVDGYTVSVNSFMFQEFFCLQFHFVKRPVGVNT